MRSNRFRPKLNDLENRETPSITPADVFVAEAQTRAADQQLDTLRANLGRPMDKGTINHHASHLPTLSFESARSAQVLNEFLASLQSQVAAAPLSAPGLAGLMSKVASEAHTAYVNSLYAAAYSIGFGASPSLYPPDPRTVPPPPPVIPLPPTLPIEETTSPPVTPATPTESISPPTTSPPTTPESPPTTSPPTTPESPPTTSPPTSPPVSPPPVSPPVTSVPPPLSTTIPDVNAPEWQTQASGLKIWDVSVGDGELATSTSTVRVNYTGWLLDGTAFNENITTNFNVQGVIQGWQEGVPGMRVGGSRRLYIPANLAYGATGSPPSIPPNATLVFEIRMLDVL